MMDLRAFRNRLCVLSSIDQPELVDAGITAIADPNEWYLFSNNPYRWLLRADDDVAAKLWALVERRAGVPAPPVPTTIAKGGVPTLEVMG